MSEKKFSKCKWCGKLYEKDYNNQVCCSKECQDKRTQELSAKRSMRHYYKHKIGNVNKKAITSLGSKGTSSTTKPKSSVEEEHKSLISEARRLGLNTKKSSFSISLEHIVRGTNMVS